MCVNDYGIKRKVISTRNPQANAIVERAHQTLGNLIRSFQLQDKPYYDPDDPWGGILAAVAFALRSMYHTTIRVHDLAIVAKNSDICAKILHFPSFFFLF